jgi:ribosomal-protein-alanine N-acetyltransferase
MTHTEGLLFTTTRLRIRTLTLEDAPYICTLLNEPSFVENIGDRGVKTEIEARHYIQEGPLQSYSNFGHGLYLVELISTHSPIGICGILQRDTLDAPDLGFALSPAFWGCGYAEEAASATMVYARDQLGINRVLAFTSPGNTRSIRLLEKLGFGFDKLVRLDSHEHDVRLFSLEYDLSELFD